jgi:hypothetical protein
MSKDSDNHRRIFDGGDDLQAAAAVRAVFDVDVEDPFEQPGLCCASARWTEARANANSKTTPAFLAIPAFVYCGSVPVVQSVFFAPERHGTGTSMDVNRPPSATKSEARIQYFPRKFCKN